MTAFILDNSVTMRWLLQSPKAQDQRYAENVLQTFVDSEAQVPNLWHLEVTNVLLAAKRRREIDAIDIERFIDQLESLPIVTDPLTAQKAFNRTLALSASYNLSSHDGAYLELAIRSGLPIATLDAALSKAARQAKVTIYRP